MHILICAILCIRQFVIVVQVQLSPFSPHHFLPSHPPPPPILKTILLWLCPWVLYTCSVMTLPVLSPVSPRSPPLGLLSVRSLFQCLWFYFACFIIIIILIEYSWNLLLPYPSGSHCPMLSRSLCSFKVESLSYHISPRMSWLGHVIGLVTKREDRVIPRLCVCVCVTCYFAAERSLYFF